MEEVILWSRRHKALASMAAALGAVLSTRVPCQVERSGHFYFHCIQEKDAGCLCGVTGSRWLSAVDLRHRCLQAVC